MKKIFIIFLIAIGFVSCKKCYECETVNEKATFCKGDYQYDLIKDGQTVTDNVGNPYECE